MHRQLSMLLTPPEGRRVAGFRLRALRLLAVPLPLLLLWLYEGGFIFLRGISGDPARIAAHRICGWLIPVTFGIVFAYGIAGTEPDVRLAALGRHDVRRLWVRRWLPIAVVFIMIAGGVAVLMSIASAESLPRLVGACVSATLFALVLGFAMFVYTGASPGTVAFLVAVAALGAMLAPLLFQLPVEYSLSPGPLGWLRGFPYRWEFLIHNLIVTALTICIVLVTLLAPRDVRSIYWITHYQGYDA